MIVFKQGNLLADEAEAHVNAVNCVGVMGAGIALHFKRMYPTMYSTYERACANGEVTIGKMHIYKRDTETTPQYIINFPTLHHYNDDATLENIELGLTDLVAVIKKLNIQSIAIPALGCGVGALQWADVRTLMEEAFEPLQNVRIHIYEPI